MEVVGTNEFTSKYQSILIILTATANYIKILTFELCGPWWSWSYGSWIYNFLRNQCLSPVKLLVRIPLGRGILDTTLCDKVCQFSPTTSVSFTNETDRHVIAEILLKVALNTINLTQAITRLTVSSTHTVFLKWNTNVVMYWIFL
jgi:hypothetical protein